MGARVPGIGLGTLKELEVLDPKTKHVRIIRPRNRWLAWDPKRQAFHICISRGLTNERVPSSIVKLHRKFHRAAPSKARRAFAPDPTGRLVQVGLLKALTYTVPRAIFSPEKNPYNWHHAFGDTGHRGGSEYPERVMPALMKDAKGNLFIKRRKGNIFRVDTWLRG